MKRLKFCPWGKKKNSNKTILPGEKIEHGVLGGETWIPSFFLF